MSWDQIGFSETLVREDSVSTQQELDPLQFESFAPELSASKLTGLMQSQDGRVKIDLDENSVIISDGIEEIIRLGKLPDGSYGVLVKDKNGNTIVQFGDVNIIQSPNQHFQANFNEEHILARDAGGTPRALLGKGEF